MLKRPVIGLGAAALALGGCSGGNTVNEGAAQNRPEAAPENQASAVAQGGRPIALDERRLVEACLPASERQLTIEQLSRARRLALNRCYNEETVRQLTPQLRRAKRARTGIAARRFPAHSASSSAAGASNRARS